jgi:hypothetical protein
MAIRGKLRDVVQEMDILDDEWTVYLGGRVGAIHGRGAFRRFKKVVCELDRLDAGYTFRERALEEIAAGWLEANSTPFEGGSGASAGGEA